MVRYSKEADATKTAKVGYCLEALGIILLGGAGFYAKEYMRTSC